MGSQRCDCGYQLNTAIDYMNNNSGKGIIVYLNQEGRGLGIHNKIISYNLILDYFKTKLNKKFHFL